MSKEKAKFRHELKYYLSLPEAALLKSRLSAVMKPDKHAGLDGSYMIRSLYFDDYFHSSYNEKDAGVLARKKYRIRIYNLDDSYISFERKLKNDQYISKQTAKLTREETDRILSGDYGFLEKSEDPFLQELYYEFTAKLLRPRVIVDYERTPLKMKEGTVRVTFDEHVRGSSNFDLFDPDLPTIDVLPADRTIVEVKFTEFLPNIIRDILPPKAAENSAISKFVLCCDTCPVEGERFVSKAENIFFKNI